ncbi:MAG: hypothetical protein WCF18_22735 [Chthoniobacteraceae bacterium]
MRPQSDDSPSPLSRAKERLRIPQLWELRGWLGKPGRSCRTPYRPDREPSGSVLAEGRLFHDFASGENFDAPALLAKVEDLSNEAACRLFLSLAGTDGQAPTEARRASIPPRDTARPKPQLPPFQIPSSAQLRQVAELRRVSVEACETASERGHLFIATWHGAECWTITDRERRNAQFRRMDGRPFAMRGGTVKAVTAAGSCAAWPIGAPDAGRAARLVLVEGGGDFLAAYHFAHAEDALPQVQPLAMLGAAQRIAPDALPLLAGKPIRLFPHLDGAGAGAAFRWESQLATAGLDAHCFDLAGLNRCDGHAVKDLNDLTQIAPDDFEHNRELWTLTTF